MSAGGKFGNDRLRRPPRFHVSVLIRKAHDSIIVSHVHVLRIRARRIKCDPERHPQTACEDVRFLELAVFRHSPENGNAPRKTFGHEQVAVGGRPNQPRTFQVVGVELDFESRRRLRHGAGRARHDLRRVRDRLRRIRLRQIRRSDSVNPARRLSVKIHVRADIGSASRRSVGAQPPILTVGGDE